MFQKPRGTVDLYGKKAKTFSALRFLIHNIMDNFNFNEIVTPIFESSELFTRSVGTGTDIISKEMFTFLDKKERSMTLRPEITAPVIRSVIENKLYADGLPLKLFYFGQCFRYERPQKGRQREFYQFGIELIGSNSYLAEVESMLVLMTLIFTLGLKNYRLKINYLLSGDAREKYIEELKKFLTGKKLCDDCKTRFKTNPLRILDCKVDKKEFNKAPKMYDHLSKDQLEYVDNVQKMLSALEIKTEIDHQLVRGFDYYTGLIFELDLISKDKSQLTVAGGGRYGNLVKELSGPELESVGFGVGIERLVLFLEENNIDLSKNDGVDVYLIGLDKKTRDFAILIANILRMNSISCEINLDDKSLKSSFKYSEQLNAKNVIVIGQEEMKSQLFKIKNQKTKKEETVNLDNLVSYIKENEDDKNS